MIAPLQITPRLSNFVPRSQTNTMVAWAYFKTGKAGDGLPNAEKALEWNPNNARAIDTTANMHEALGKRHKAISFAPH